MYAFNLCLVYWAEKLLFYALVFKPLLLATTEFRFFFAFISIVTFFSLRLPVAIVVYDIGIFFSLRRSRSSSAGQEINRKMLICQKLVIINLT